MNLLTLAGTTTVPLTRSPFVPSSGRNVVVFNLGAAAVQPRSSADGGATWTNWGASIPAVTAVQLEIPQGANAVSLAAAGAAFIVSAP
jgi:basic membrane lipoprotein Med (substrate-binding protein (PBP1-ABC) superfamily)